MPRENVLIIIIGALAMFFACPFLPGATVEIVPSGSTVVGKTIGEWTADWWNWTGSVPGNVFEDPSGALATQNQSGPVFFVAGTGADGVASRSFDIPQGKHVLFPLINWIIAAGPDPGFDSTAEEVEAVTTATINPANLFATIDGIDVPDLASHRERSPINFTYATVEGAGGFPPGTYTDANADGYWLMLAPLPPGEHTLHFGGTATEYAPLEVPSFTINATANVSVIPLPPAVFTAMPVLALMAAASLRGVRKSQICGFLKGGNRQWRSQ
jgi:hypothetical protein